MKQFPIINIAYILERKKSSYVPLTHQFVGENTDRKFRIKFSCIFFKVWPLIKSSSPLFPLLQTSFLFYFIFTIRSYCMTILTVSNSICSMKLITNLVKHKYRILVMHILVIIHRDKP